MTFHNLVQMLVTAYKWSPDWKFVTSTCMCFFFPSHMAYWFLFVCLFFTRKNLNICAEVTDSTTWKKVRDARLDIVRVVQFVVR